MSDIDDKVRVIKHAINLNNVTNQMQVGDKMMTIEARFQMLLFFA